jgi:hypothetical protein
VTNAWGSPKGAVTSPARQRIVSLQGLLYVITEHVNLHLTL